VLSSTYTNFELIIVDDGSADNTVMIANEFAKNDRRITVFRNVRNLTQFPNRNRAAGLAKGKYIKYVDSDDTIYPWSLQYCVEMMEKYPAAGMGVLYLKDEINDEYLLQENAIKKNYFQSTLLNICPGATILRTELFRKAGYYDVNYGIPSDMYFNLKMANLYPVVLLKKDFFFYRTHEGQELNNRYSYLQYNYRYLKDAFKLPGFPLNSEQKKYLLRRQRFWYVRDFLVYTKNTGKIGKAVKAAYHSGLSFINFISGLVELLLIQLRLKRNY
jgi:glycosyltransferase involved in cell wall biosynthesis